MKYRILEGAESMRLEDVVRLLRMTYWAGERPVERIETSLRHSACCGVRPEEEERLAGFARVITDHATTCYLCGVGIDEDCRGRGLGTALPGHITSRPEYAGLRGLPLTRDAHGLYAKFGFRPADRAMWK